MAASNSNGVFYSYEICCWKDIFNYVIPIFINHVLTKSLLIIINALYMNKPHKY